MKALIIEDKQHIRKALIHLLAAVDNSITVLGECESVKVAVVVANACQPELVFLDINLKDGTGFDFLDQVTDISFKVIFITAYEEYALQALKAGALDYLLKPVDPDELRLALAKLGEVSVIRQRENIRTAKQVLDHGADTLILSLQDSLQVIKLNELMFCESDKGYTTFYLSDGKKYLASKPLKEFEAQLSGPRFTRPHQSFIVNMHFVDRYEKSGTIRLKNGACIPVATRKKDNFISRLLSWGKT